MAVSQNQPNDSRIINSGFSTIALLIAVASLRLVTRHQLSGYSAKEAVHVPRTIARQLRAYWSSAARAGGICPALAPSGFALCVVGFRGLGPDGHRRHHDLWIIHGCLGRNGADVGLCPGMHLGRGLGLVVAAAGALHLEQLVRLSSANHHYVLGCVRLD